MCRLPDDERRHERSVRGHRLAVEHVLGMLAAGDSTDDLLGAYPWLERDDVLACLVYARRVVSHERVEPAITDAVGGERLMLLRRREPSRIEDGPAILDYKGPRIPIAQMHGGFAMIKAARRARR